MTTKLGEVMIEQGLLTSEQVETILREQQTRRRPFGELAETLFDVSERDVERAWATQYAQLTQHIDPSDEQLDPAILELIDRRQAWQFKIIPIRRDGNELMVATTLEYLPRALRFALRHFNEPCYLVLADPDRLGRALVTRYPLDGMTAESVSDPRASFLQTG